MQAVSEKKYRCGDDNRGSERDEGSEESVLRGTAVKSQLNSSRVSHKAPLDCDPPVKGAPLLEAERCKNREEVQI